MAVRALTLDRKLFPTEERAWGWIRWTASGPLGVRLGALGKPKGAQIADSKGEWLVRPLAEILEQVAVDRRNMGTMKAETLGQGVTLYED
jgi:hypothetical protein